MDLRSKLLVPLAVFRLSYSAGQKVNEEEATARREMLRSVVEEESDVYFTTSRLLDDGVIDPRQTRNVLGFCLSVCYGDEVKGGNLYGVSRM